MRRLALVAPIVLLLALPAARARAACDPATAAAEAAGIRAHLEREHRRAWIWDLGWGLGLGAIAGAQVGLIAAEVKPLATYDNVAEASLTIGAINASIGALGHVVTPLRITRPGPPTGDACADLAAAEAALAASARAEAKAFYVTHAGAFVLNASGALYLGLVEDDWAEGLTSFAVGYAFGLIPVYTLPRASWRYHRDDHRFAADAAPAAAWLVAPVHAPGFTGLALAGTF
jgi:uncharacterized membrane protein YfcA